MANTSPIFPQTPKVSWVTLQTAQTATDGTTATIGFTAGVNGSRIDQIKARSLGTNSTAGVLRIFVNNAGLPGTSTNNVLVHEVSLPATTGSNTSALTDYDITIPKGTDIAVPVPYLQANYRISLAFSQNAAAGWQVTIHGADY